MINRPAKFPDWALNDVIDPVEGTPNVVLPPDKWQSIGWSPNEVVPNNFLNWIHRTTNDWLKYLDQQVPHAILAKSSKPLASAYDAGKMIYINDKNGGFMAFSDGKKWRKVSDNTIVE